MICASRSEGSQVILAAETLGIDLVDVFGAGRARGKPAVLGDDLDAADRRIVAGRAREHALMGSPAISVIRTCCGDRFASFRFCSALAGASMRVGCRSRRGRGSDRDRARRDRARSAR